MSGQRLLFPIFLCILASVLYYHFSLGRAEINITAMVEQPCWLKVYWANDGIAFSEQKMARMRAEPGYTNYRLLLGDLRRIDAIRIDCHDYIGNAVLTDVKIKQKGFKDIEIVGSRLHDDLQPNSAVEKRWFENDGLHFSSSTNDAHFTYIPQTTRLGVNIWLELLRLGLLWVFVFLCYHCLAYLAIDLRFVPVCLAIILAISGIMALNSKSNVHPDEFVHVVAVDYYKDNWLPPKIMDESIRESYSPYGVSRLNSDEIFYFVAGKVAKVTEPFLKDDYSRARVSSLLFLLIIFIYTVRVQESRLLALPFLLSPQIWYSFSYSNSDCFALMVAFFFGCQLADRNSLINRFLLRCEDGNALFAALITGGFLGLLLLLKHNFYAFLLFVVVCYALFFFTRIKEWQRRQYLIRLGVVICISFSLFAAKRVADFSVNGLERDSLVAKARVEFADKDYVELIEKEKMTFTLHMKDHGISAKDVLFKYLWLEKTFNSSFGIFGYWKIKGHSIYYGAIGLASLLILAYVVITVLTKGTVENRLIMASAGVIGLMLITASFYHSWVGDFQPQGRYLYPIVSMFGAVLALNRRVLSERWLSLLSFWVFMLSGFAFVTVALHYIPRNI